MEESSCMKKRKMDESYPVDIVLNEDQQNVYDAVIKERKNYVILGFAGTGKSTLLKKMVTGLRGLDLNVGVTSMTGSSAIVIDGKTLHSFLNMGIGREKDFQEIIRKEERQKPWQETDVLFIDECSMMNGDLFFSIDQTARLVRRRDEAFGGMQIVMMGDMFQILPVEKTIFFFKTISFSEGKFEHKTLKKFERAQDEKLINIMQRIINGEFDSSDLEVLNTPNWKIPLNDPTIIHLHSKHAKADVYNEKCLNNLGNEQFFFPSEEARRLYDEKGKPLWKVKGKD